MSFKKILIKSQDHEKRLSAFLLKYYNINYNILNQLIRKKKIKINGQKIDTRYILKSQDLLFIDEQILTKKDLQKPQKKQYQPTKEEIKQIIDSIIYKDDNLIAIDKPCNVATQGGSKIDFNIDSVLPFLKFEQLQTPMLVHRLDRATSGVLLLARNNKSVQILTDQFRQKTIEKSYLALVKGIPKQQSGKIDIPLLKKYQNNQEKVYKDLENGKKAVTFYKVIKEYQDYCLLELKPITGRTHQIRVHLKEIGYPIIGDFKYAGNNGAFIEDSKRLHLHAYKIKLNDFFGKKIEIIAKKHLDFYKEPS